jgi:quercetin dioxygenase-like cupin family protein
MDTMPPDTVLGPVGSELLFENESIRVWSVDLKPGARQAWHKHDVHYLIVPLTEGLNVMTFADGRVRETRETVGSVLWRDPGIPHQLENTSDWNYRNVLIEMKKHEPTPT